MRHCFLTSLALGALLAGCSCGDAIPIVGGLGDAGGPTDAGPDASRDAAPDAMPDAAPDAAPDGGDCGCDDGIACTDDACPAEPGGDCSHEPVDERCGGGAVCDPEDGCVEAQRCEDDSDCDDDDACNGEESCGLDGYCAPGTELDCTDDVDCTEDSCVGGACQNVPDSIRCGDGFLCDAEAGCEVAPECADDVDCDDGYFCNGEESCGEDGLCEPGTPPVCADQHDCTLDECGEIFDRCFFEPHDTDCDDGTFCNGAEWCDVDEGCVAGSAPACDDDDACTIDSCDSDDDACENVDLDVDGDGQGPLACGGLDCDDAVGTTYDGAPEICNTIDDSCDGRVDEGVLSACGDCRADCRVSENGGEGGWTIDDSTGVAEAEGGGLVLESETSEDGYAWIANSPEGTVSKLDFETGVEVGRYRTGIGGVFDTWGSEGGSPSRSALDGHGDAYVASRAFGIQGTVTKIATDSADCVDRDLDGTIDTSQNNVPMAYQAPGFPSSDECVLWSVPVGPNDGVPRAMAVDAGDDEHPYGYPWVGLFNARQIVKVDPETGGAVETINVDVNPYGMAIAADGRIWMAHSCCGRNGIESYDPATGTLSGLIAHGGAACAQQYGIAVDGQSRVWLAGGWGCEGAYRYDPTDASWMVVAQLAGAAGRGIAVDGQGRVWMAAHAGADGYLFGFDVENGGVLFDENIGGLTPVGVGIDNAGRIWTANQGSNNATRYDPVTDAEDTFPVGNAPYTYSDFTGLQRRTFTAPSGTMSQYVTADCGGGAARWEEVEWVADTPDGTSIELRVRSAPDVGSLAAQPFVGPWLATPADLAAAPGPVPDDVVAQIQVSLLSDAPGSTPILWSVTVRYECL